VADVNVDDYTKFEQGETFTKTWHVENIGTCTWSDAYSLVFFSGDQMDAPASLPLRETAPGETLEISVDMTAPARDVLVRADFELHNPARQAMPIDSGQYLWVVVSVGNPETTSSGSSGRGSSSSGSRGGSGSSGGVGGPCLTDASCAYTVDAARTAAVATAINSYRSQNGLSALAANPLLTQAAQTHSADMACNQLF
jgi:hypothetical protein